MSVKAVLVDGMVLLDDSVVNERTIIAGASPGPQVDLSALGNGALQQTVTLGVSTLSVYTPANNLAKFIVQQPDASLPNAQALSALTTGLVKNTTTTGVLSIAVDGVDYFSPATAFYPNAGAGPTALGAVGVAATLARGDQKHASYRSDLPLSTTWFIDPVSGSDAPTNPGTSSATALATLQELKRRWWGAEISTATTVTILGNVSGSDTGSWNFAVAQGAIITFIGSLGSVTGFGGRSLDNTLYSGSVTAFAAASDAPSATDSQLTDAAIPVSFTASGLLAQGVLFRRTNSTSLYWFAAKDLGSKTIRVSPPALNTIVSLSSALSVADTYTAYAMWQVPTQDFGPAEAFVRFDSLYDTSTLVTGTGVGYDRRRCWINASSVRTVSGRNGWLNNCYDATAGNGNLLAAPTGTSFSGVEGGLFLGNGSSVVTFGGFVEFGWGMVQQGCQVSLDDCILRFPGPSIGQYDLAIPAISLVGRSVLDVSAFSGGTGFVGKGNSSKLVSTSLGYSTVYYGSASAAPPWFAGATTDASPIQIQGTSYAVSALPSVPNVTLPGETPFPTTAFETGARTRLTFDAVSDQTLVYRNGVLLQGASVGAGLALTAGTLSATTGSASWATSATRFFAVDGVNGNDANAGFSDVSPAAAGAAAKKTLTAISLIIPPDGAGHVAMLYVANGGVNTSQAYPEIATFLEQLNGYEYFGVSGTGTNANAGAVAFDGSVNTQLYAGGITVPGLNAAGYNPTGAATTTSIPCTLNGGGAPSLPAEPAAPLGWRVRFDINTATVALRGICKTIVSVSGGTTIGILTALSTRPSVSDIFYIEKAGVLFTNASAAVGVTDTQNMVVAGVDFQGQVLVFGGLPTFMFCGCNFLVGGRPNVVVATNRVAGIAQAGAVVSNRGIGGSLRNAGPYQNSFGGSGLNLQLATMVGTVELLAGPGANSITDGTVFGAGAVVHGNFGDTNWNDAATQFGGISTPVRFIAFGVNVGFASGLQLRGCSVQLRNNDFQNMGAHPAIVVIGMCNLMFAGTVGLTGSTGNSDVGMDLLASQGSRIVLHTIPTVTGTAGDVRLSDGTIITWAQAATGIADAAGNTIVSTANWPIQRLPTGTYLKDLSAGGFVQAAAGTGLLSVGLVPGASVYADGIVTGAAKLTLISAALLQAGTIAYVNSVDDSFQLQANTQTPDNITIVAALGKAGFNWVRLGIYSARWAAVTAWTLDPANVSTTASDENPASGNLLTYSELARRLSQVVFTAPITITVTSDQQPSDKPVFTYKTTAENQVTFLGIPTLLHTGTVTAYIAATVGTPAADDNELTDTGIPTSFTASGLMAPGVLFQRTNGAPVAWWAAKDLGSKTIRISWPFNLSAVTTIQALSPGDTYTASSLPLLSHAIFPVGQEFGTIVKNFESSRLNNPGGETIFYQQNWFTATGRDGGAFYNCAFQGNYNWNGNGGSSSRIAVVGGLFLGTGSTTFNIESVQTMNFEGNALTVQSARILIELSQVVAFQINFYDVPDNGSFSACLWLLTESTYQQTVHCIGGKGNSTPMVSVTNSWAVNVSFTDASTSFSPSMYVNNIGYHEADLPVSDVNSSTYVGSQALPLGAGLVQSNTSGILSLATIGNGLTFTGGTLKVTGPATAVTFFDSGGNVAGDPSKFQWDDTNHRIYISSTNAADTAGMAGLLNLQLETAGSEMAWYSANSGTGARNEFVYDLSKGTRAAPTAVTANSVLADHVYRAYSGTAYRSAIAQGVGVPTDATVASGSVPLTWYINASPTGTGAGTGMNAQSGWAFAATYARNVFLGEPNIATGATDGFVYLPAMAGAPVGLPTYVFGGTQNQNRDPVVIDDTDSRFYSYIGSWKILGQYDGSFGPAIVQTDASGVHSAVTVGSGLSYSGGILSTSGGGGTVTSVSGAAPIVITGTPTTTPTVTLAFDHASLTLNGSNQLQRSAQTGDVTSPAGSNVTTLVNIPNDTTMAGDIITSQTAAPVTPGAGLGRVWFDSTSKNYLGLNESAVKTAMVQAHTAVAHQFLTAITLAGVWSAAQPDYSDLTGAVPAITQLTGDVVAGPGSGSLVATLATVNSSVGTFTNATLTVNGKGLITGASSGAPITAGTGIHLVASTQVALGSASSPAAPTIAEFGNIPATTASAVNLGPLYEWDSVTLTLTGSTHHTGSSLGLVKFFAPTITNASAMTIDTAGTVIVGGAPAAAGSVTITNSYALWVASGITRLDGNVQVGVLAAGGIVKAAASTGQLGIASPGTDYQAPITWPALGEILYSSGTSSVPVGNANLIVDPTFGATVVVGDTFARNQGNQLRVVPQASMVATSVCSPDTLLVDTQTVTITSPTNVSYGGGWDTVRIQPTVYVAGSAMSIASAASVKIEGDAVGGTNVTITNPYALWIGGGHTRLDGPLQLSTVTGPALLQVDASGNVSAGSTTPSPFASYKFSINTAGSVGINSNQASVIVPGDSGAIVTGAGIYSAAAGTAIASTLGTNYGIAGGVCAYRVNRAATHFALQFTQLSATVAVANGANMGYALYSSSSPFSNAWTQLGGWSTGAMNIGTLANSGLTSGIITGSCSVAAGDVIAIAGWRTDAVAASTLSILMFSATVDLME